MNGSTVLLTEGERRPAAGRGLPVPRRERWQPLRAGLVDLFYYDIEEFHFHDGRLLLRGNNGTGKSKVLALTLPFLLDGELAPHRVEPDMDRNKRMEWNLLLGGKHPHPERLGYSWLEFGRLDPDGAPEYRTIGAGLKAVAGRGMTRHWFFVTRQRVGEDLFLLGPTRVALTREKLREALEGHGSVHDTASDYRRAVDEALFGLGQHRYEALVNLLIQLRQPQLSKKPDEKMLSRALTEALPPLDPALVTTVAEAFRGLDEEREALRAFTEARAATDAFLTHYRRYAQVAAKRFAAPPRVAQSRYARQSADLGEADAAHAAAETALAEALRRVTAAEEQRGVLRTREQALRDSPAMRDAESLSQAALRAREQTRMAQDRASLDRRAAEAVATWQRRLAEAMAMLGEDEALLADAGTEAQAGADAALLAERHAGVLAALADDTPPFTHSRAVGDTAVRAQEQAVRRLEELLAAFWKAATAAAEARAALDRIGAQREQAAERITEAEDTVDRAGDGLIEAATAYLAACAHLRVADTDAVLAALAGWTENLDGANPFVLAVDDAARTATAALGRRQAAVDAESTTTRARRGDVEAEIARLVAGGHDAPPAPHTRGPGARENRPGAPLWKVVDFADGTPAETRAAVEAALEAAGILDAWVDPDGTLRDAASGDVVVTAGTAAPGEGLGAVLVPAVNRDDAQAAVLTDAALAAVLASIGLVAGAGDGSGTTWVATDGRFRNGVLTGAWAKKEAQYIGEGAREAARQARLADLRAEQESLTTRLAELADAAARLVGEQESLAAEHRALPGDAALRDAHSVLVNERRNRAHLDEEHTRAARAEAALRADAAAARETAEEFASDVRLPADQGALHAVRAALGAYRAALVRLFEAARATARSRAAAASHEAELESATRQRAQAAEDYAEARTAAEEAAERHRVLQETAGAAVEELRRQLAEVNDELAACAREEKDSRAAADAARDARGEAEGRRAQLRVSIEAAAAERDAAIERLRAFTATGLLVLAAPEVEALDPSAPWAPTNGVALARSINAVLESVDDSDRRWERVQENASREHKTLTDALARYGHAVGMVLSDGVMVVDVVFQGRRRDVASLVAALAAEVEQRALLLSAKEREILENHLVNEVAGALQDLITSAEEQVGQINDSLAARPTSTGMRLRLQWRAARDAPEGLAAVRDRLMRQTADAWSSADRSAVGTFLQRQIEEEHHKGTAGGWAEQLTAALDYRGWHEFAVQRWQDGQWRPASGPASGGERVLAASVPLFAAAASFYDSAGGRFAPRLIALDEAFAGVDDDSRAKCLGLLALFDLDVVMTSEREWGCYPSVPGLAISQLARRDGVDAVLVTPWRWDGRERRRLERPEPALREEPLPPGAGDGGDGLFAG